MSRFENRSARKLELAKRASRLLFYLLPNQASNLYKEALDEGIDEHDRADGNADDRQSHAIGRHDDVVLRLAPAHISHNIQIGHKLADHHLQRQHFVIVDKQQ